MEYTKDQIEAILKAFKDHAEELNKQRATRNDPIPGIYPCEPPWKPRQCSCSRMMHLCIPPNHYYQCECGNRIYGSSAMYGRPFRPDEASRWWSTGHINLAMT